MLDIRFVRENQEAVAEAMRNRNFAWDAQKFSDLDEQRREAIAAEESLQAQRNKSLQGNWRHDGRWQEGRSRSR